MHIYPGTQWDKVYTRCQYDRSNGHISFTHSIFFFRYLCSPPASTVPGQDVGPRRLLGHPASKQATFTHIQHDITPPPWIRFKNQLKQSNRVKMAHLSRIAKSQNGLGFPARRYAEAQGHYSLKCRGCREAPETQPTTGI
jgi:hypothetical protein